MRNLESKSKKLATIKHDKLRDFPGGPVVKTSTSTAGALPCWGTKILQAQSCRLKKKIKNKKSRVGGDLR